METRVFGSYFDPAHEEFERYREWAGNPVHAEAFDLKAVNEILGRVGWPKIHRFLIRPAPLQPAGILRVVPPASPTLLPSCRSPLLLRFPLHRAEQLSFTSRVDIIF